MPKLRYGIVNTEEVLDQDNKDNIYILTMIIVNLVKTCKFLGQEEVRLKT